VSRLATRCSKAAVCELMRVSWYTVGRIIERVVVDERARRATRSTRSAVSGSTSSHNRVGQRYIAVVVDHDSGLLVWAREGRDKGDSQALSSPNSARNGAPGSGSSRATWASGSPRRRRTVPAATLCLDPFHIVARQRPRRRGTTRVWNQARRSGDTAAARFIKGSRYALWKRPERLTEKQKLKLSRIAKLNQPL